MANVRILTETQLRAQVSLDADLIDVIEQAFATLARGGVIMPPILSMGIPVANAEVDVKTAYLPGADGFAVKISPGFFDNPERGLPSLNGLMVLLDAHTGIVKALLLDNGYLTAVRTAAAGAVAARHLAPERVETVTVFGTGEQAELQIQALKRVRDFKALRVWGRDADKARAYAEKMRALLDVAVAPVADAPSAVQGAQVIVTTTPARSPLLHADWLEPGQHITAMGSDAAEKNELDPAIFRRADRYVCDRRTQCAVLGELRHAIAAGSADADTPVPELGQIIIGETAGRTSEDQITVCDLTGTGIQDTAIANLALQRCRASGVGTQIES